MKQILQSYRTGEMWLAEVPAPICRPGSVVVRTQASVVSAGTERMIMELAQKSLLGKARERPDLVKKVLKKVKTEGLSATVSKVFAKLDAPIPLGYSSAGEVIEVGAGVSCLKIGDRVACAGAGYANHAEINCVPVNLCARIPEGVNFEDAAFTTIGAIAMQGVRQADVRLGETVAVIGLGLVGLLTVQLLKASGCRVIGSDPDKGRCDLADELGAEQVVTDGLTTAASKFTSGRGVDAVIITAATKSNAPIEEAAEISRMKGRVVAVGAVGMDVPRNAYYAKELDLRLSMSYGPGRYDENYEERGNDYPFAYVRWTEQRNMQAFLDLIAEKKITPTELVSHRFGIDDSLDAYQLVESGGKDVTGMVLTYDEAADEEVDRTLHFTECKPLAEVRIGLIGAGNFAKGVLLPALRGMLDIQLTALCARNGAGASETGGKYGFARATTNADEIISDEDINTIIIATRHDSHAELVLAAMKAGKHVFVEKPLSIKPEQLDEIESVYAEQIKSGNAGSLTVGFNRRFSTHADAVKKAFVDRTQQMVVNYRVNAGEIPSDSWIQNSEEGGGRIIGEVCHFVDLCEYITGSEPVRVYAASIGDNGDRAEVADSVLITIDYADGSVASIQYVTNGSGNLPKEHIEVTCGGAAAVVKNFCSTEFHGVRAETVSGRQDKGFTAELTALVDAVKVGGGAPISPASLFRTTRVTFAICESLRTGAAVQL